jgi:hypothetical protein
VQARTTDYSVYVKYTGNCTQNGKGEFISGFNMVGENGEEVKSFLKQRNFQIMEMNKLGSLLGERGLIR